MRNWEDLPANAQTVPRIASCERGFERIVPTPVDWTEQKILVWSSQAGFEPFFPECVVCEPDDDGIMISPDDAGVFHRVRTCPIRFREVC